MNDDSEIFTADELARLARDDARGIGGSTSDGFVFVTRPAIRCPRCGLFDHLGGKPHHLRQLRGQRPNGDGSATRRMACNGCGRCFAVSIENEN